MWLRLPPIRVVNLHGRSLAVNIDGVHFSKFTMTLRRLGIGEEREDRLSGWRALP